MVLGSKSNICTICKKKGKTDWHHIISQHHAKRSNQKHLLSNPNNVIELCRKCHNQTTASMVRKRLIKKERSSSSEKRSYSSKISKKGVIEKNHRILAKQKAREERILAKQKAREERILVQKKNQEIKLTSIENLKLRGVFIENPPSYSKRDFVKYLKQNMAGDEILSKWFNFFHNNYRRINLNTLYPRDHWLHNSKQFDEQLSANYEEEGFFWTETGFTWHNPVKPPTLDEQIYENIIGVVNMVKKELVKSSQEIENEFKGALRYLLIGK
jgi:hypothetical protein